MNTTLKKYIIISSNDIIIDDVALKEISYNDRSVMTPSQGFLCFFPDHKKRYFESRFWLVHKSVKSDLNLVWQDLKITEEYTGRYKTIPIPSKKTSNKGFWGANPGAVPLRFSKFVSEISSVQRFFFLLPDR